MVIKKVLHSRYASLNKMVALTVFKFKKVKEDSFRYETDFTIEVFKTLKAACGAGVRIKDKSRQKILVRDIPDFIGDARLNSLVASKLRASGGFCCIDIKCDYDYSFDIYLTPSEIFDRKSIHAPLIHVSSEYLNVAICIAAVAGLGDYSTQGKIDKITSSSFLKLDFTSLKFFDKEKRLVYRKAGDAKNKILSQYYQKKRPKQ